jgi:hypothetical protein
MSDSDVAGAFDGLTQAQKSLAVQSAGMDSAQAERMVRDESDRDATVQTGYGTTIEILDHKAGCIRLARGGAQGTRYMPLEWDVAHNAQCTHREPMK